VAAIATELLSLTLPLERSEAVTTGTLFSFVVMIVVVLFVFAARSLGRALVVVGVTGLLLAAALWLAAGVLPLGLHT
jgi:hypothetical protein